MLESDPFDLQRFLSAQESVINNVNIELRRGRKDTHWMWFIFPQFAGLGHSSVAQQYAIKSFVEARQYFKHPILGRRLLDCIVLALESGKGAAEIFGYPDYLKFRSCLTLFSVAAPDEPLFNKALEQFYDADPDRETLRLLSLQNRGFSARD